MSKKLPKKSTQKSVGDTLIQMENQIHPFTVISIFNCIIHVPEGNIAQQRAFIKQELIVHIRNLVEARTLTDAEIDIVAEDWISVTTYCTKRC